MVRAVANGRARADIAGGCLAVGTGDALEAGFAPGAGRDLVGAGLDAVMHPLIDALALLAVRVVHDDGVALGGCRAGVPVQCRGNVMSATARGVAGGGRREQAVIGDSRNV
ncbi:hypothetical protein D9M69_571270 [compost metagenome]